MLSSTNEQLLESYLHGAFEGVLYRRLIERVERWTLRVEILNANGNSQQTDRWELPQDTFQYAYASRGDCYSAKYRLLAQIVFMEDAPLALMYDLLKDELMSYYKEYEQGVICPITGQTITFSDVKSALEQTSAIGTSEINIDFVDIMKRNHPQLTEDLHWIKPPHYLYSLRTVAKSDVLLDKAQRKTYLTDRRQTGESESNRIKRWDIPLTDPQYAQYRQCIQIEAKLLAQVYEFLGAPKVEIESDLLKQIQDITGSNMTPRNFHCPISGQLIEYDTFIQRITAAKHGESPYQVAHLIPLAYPGGKHVVENISWITDLGNRVQGDDPIDKIVREIFVMANYHKEQSGLSWQDVERIAKEAKDIREHG